MGELFALCFCESNSVPRETLFHGLEKASFFSNWRSKVIFRIVSRGTNRMRNKWYNTALIAGSEI